MNYKISIILPFFYTNTKTLNINNNFSLLAFDKCLSAIFKSHYKNYEVIAISDNSSKESLNIAKKYPCKIVKLKKNYGAAFSRNKGASISKGEILVFLDSDVEIKKTESDEIIAITTKAEGKKCPVCWKINKNGCVRHPI